MYARDFSHPLSIYLSFSLFVYFLLSLTSRLGEKEKDYHSTMSGHQTTRLLNRGKRMTVATDLVAASLATACFLPYSITAVTDSGRQRLVLLSTLWGESARELFRGIGFLGERAARDAIVLPASVPIADYCVPAHTTASSLDDEDCRRPERTLSVSRLRPRRGDATGDLHADSIPEPYQLTDVHLFLAPVIPPAVELCGS